MRRATQADIPRMVELGRAMHTESRFRNLKFNDDKVVRLFTYAVTQPSLILLVDGEPAHAMLFAYVQPFWWGDDLESDDLLLYVTPEMRGKSSAVRLVNEYKRITKSMGVADPRLSTGTGVETERTGRLFERLGFAGAGLMFSLKQGRAICAAE